LTLSPSLKSDASTSQVFLGANDTGFYLVEFATKNFSGNTKNLSSAKLLSFDYSMAKTNTKSFELTPANKAKRRIIGVASVGETLLLTSSIRYKEKFVVSGQKLDTTNSTFGPAQTLSEVSIPKGMRLFGKVNFENSPDKSLMYLSHPMPFKNKIGWEYEMKLAVLDSDLNHVWDNTVNIKDDNYTIGSNTDMFSVKFNLTDEGSLFLVGGKLPAQPKVNAMGLLNPSTTGDARINLPARPSTETLGIFELSSLKSEMIPQEYQSEEYFWPPEKIYLDKERNLVVWSQQKNKPNDLSTFNCLMQGVEGKTTEEFKYKVDEEFLTMGLSESRKALLSRKIENQKNIGDVARVRFSDALMAESGNQFLIFHTSAQRTNTTHDVSPSANGSGKDITISPGTELVRNQAISVSCLNSNGEIKWNSSVPINHTLEKSRLVTGYSRDMYYISFERNNELYIIYNDVYENIDKTKFEDVKRYKGMSEPSSSKGPILMHVSADGAVSRTKLIDDSSKLVLVDGTFLEDLGDGRYLLKFIGSKESNRYGLLELGK